MATAAPRVAVVDDEASVRTALSRLLRLVDFDVAMFASGEEFLAALDTGRPDCAIIDIHMPGLSGFDVQARLNALHIDIPVVFITASDEVNLKRPMPVAGCAQLLRKPFSSDELITAVRAAIPVQR